MLNKVKNDYVGTWRYNNTNFYIEVFQNEKVLSAYLYHKDYSVKVFVVGYEESDIDLFLNIVEGNIETSISFYIKEYISD